MPCHGKFSYAVLCYHHYYISHFLKNLIVTGKVYTKLRNVLSKTDVTILLPGTTRAHVATVIIIRSAVSQKISRITYILQYILKSNELSYTI
jgi:transcription initiation factor TFIIIB Brf1 subunit/transcription initiation factor TFIIB